MDLTVSWICNIAGVGVLERRSGTQLGVGLPVTNPGGDVYLVVKVEVGAGNTRSSVSQ